MDTNMREVMKALFQRYLAFADETAEQKFSANDKCDKSHVKHLCVLAIRGIEEERMAYGKLSRWLGYIQGVLAVAGAISVDAEREFTRPIFESWEKAE